MLPCLNKAGAGVMARQAMGGVGVCVRRAVCVVIGALAMQVRADEPQYEVWRGDVDGQFSFSKSEYTSRQVTLDANVSYLLPGREFEGEMTFERAYIKEEGNRASLDKDKYDANVKLRQYFEESPYYAYVSPRVRHNRFGYYQSAQALRTGLGRKFGGDGDWVVNLELGSGYRVARVEGGENVSEVLYTATLKTSWAISETLSLRFNGVQEQSRRETFRTMSLALRNKITRSIGLKYEVVYQRSYPFDALEKDGELSADFGISYSF